MTTRNGWLAADAEPPALGESRGQVLAVLQDAGERLSVAAVADRVGLHPNTARFHLDGLVDAGLAERTPEERAQPGRPRMLYRAVATTGRVGQRNYRLLSEILAGYLAARTPEPAKAAIEAGEAWGRFLAERPAPYRKPDEAAAAEQLVSALDGIGFAPRLRDDDGARRVELWHCPFREAAEQHREVVCSIHLGLMRGLLKELDAPIEARQLDPFVQPSLCVAHLGPKKRARRRTA